MTKHEWFDWDDRKARSNVRKHGITFEDAAAVLADPIYEMFHLERFDLAQSDAEDRFGTIGTDPADRSVVLVVTWTDRDGVTRLINARLATAEERRSYEAEIQVRQNHPKER